MRRLGSIAKKAGASPSVLARRGHQARTALSETQQRFKLGELIQAYDSKCASHLPSSATAVSKPFFGVEIFCVHVG